MSVSGTSTKSVYTADGSNKYFPYSWEILESSDVQLWVTDLNSNTSQVTTNFDVDTSNSRVIYPNVASGLGPLASGYIVTVIRVLPLTQPVDLVNQGVTDLGVLEEAYDRLTLITQQLQEQLNRSVKYPIQETPTNPTPSELLDVIDSALLACANAVSLINNVFGVSVGSASYCQYSSLSAALAGVSPGTRLLIVSDQVFASSVTISLANISIECLSGITISDGGAGTGLILAASGIRIKGCRFSGFTVNAIQINSGSVNNIISENRFSSSSVGLVLDNNGNSANSAIFGNIEE